MKRYLWCRAREVALVCGCPWCEHSFDPDADNSDEDQVEDAPGAGAGSPTRPPGATSPAAAATVASPTTQRRVERTGVQKAARQAAKLAMKTSDVWKLFVSRKSIHHYLARRILTRDAVIAAGKQVP
jgi:hypothetical protein